MNELTAPLGTTSIPVWVVIAAVVLAIVIVTALMRRRRGKQIVIKTRLG